ncbi:MAG: hypothetical protein KGO81_08230 [Bacteroidota bacterium]|nr:hypothetical protein [Bacteroidota bacterium]
MKNRFLPILCAACLLASCSTTYQSTQTPDDLYYSPTRGVREERIEDKQTDRYEDYLSSNDDRYLWMKVQNRQLWSSIDDYSYWYDSRYDFANNYYNDYYNNGFYLNIGWYNGWNNYLWNNYYSWNTPYYGWWYTPACTVIGYKNPRVGTVSTSYLSAYLNKNYNNANYFSNFSRKFNNANYATGTNNFGSLMKRVFSTASSGSTSQWSTPVRTFAPVNNGSTYSPPATSSSAGGRSGGYGSTGSSSGGGRGSRGN